MNKFYLLILSVFSLFSVEASHISMEEYATLIGQVNPERKNIATLNDCGSTYYFATELTEIFLEKCREARPNFHVLEIGCAFGIKSSQIVQAGASLVAMDIEEKHIKKMREVFSKYSEKDPLFLNTRYIVDNIANLEREEIKNEEFDAILAESIFHFLTPEEIPFVLNNCYKLLKEGGEIYITVQSPFLKYLVNVYEENIKRGEKWPGFILDPEKIHPVYARLHKPYLFFDQETLERELKKAGFEIILIKYIKKPHQEHDMSLDGREGLIAIAKKIQ